jgi:hypothetical protein
MERKARFTLAAMTSALALGAVSCVAPAAEPSPEFQAGLRRTAELRKQRRRDRTPQPVGVIVPYPSPPALIIRHRPEVHHEVRSLLDLLRR